MAAARKQSGDCDDTYPVRLGRWQVSADKEGAVDKANAAAALCWKAVGRSCSNRYRGAQTSQQQHAKILTNSFHSYTHKPSAPRQELNLFDSLPEKSRAASPRSTWAQPLKLGRKRLCLARYSAKRQARQGMQHPPLCPAAASPSKPAKIHISASRGTDRSYLITWWSSTLNATIMTWNQASSKLSKTRWLISLPGSLRRFLERSRTRLGLPTGHPEVKCLVCNELGHRARDCTQERVGPHACRNCKQCGHKTRDCPEPHSVADEETKRLVTRPAAVAHCYSCHLPSAPFFRAEHESPSKKLTVLCLKEISVSKKVELEAELNKLRSNVAEQRAKLEAIWSASDSHPLAYSHPNNHIDVKAGPPSPEVPTRSASDATGAYLLFWVPRRVSFAHIGQWLMPTSSEERGFSVPLSCRHSSYARSLTRRFIHLFPCPTPLLVQVLERACPEAHLFVCSEAPVLYTPPPTSDEANGQETKSSEDTKAGPKAQSSVSAPDPVAAVLNQIFQDGPPAAPPADTERADSVIGWGSDGNRYTNNKEDSASKMVAERKGRLCFSIPPSESDSESTTLAPRRGGRKADDADDADDAANALPPCLLLCLDGERVRPLQKDGGGKEEGGGPRRRTRGVEAKEENKRGLARVPRTAAPTRRVASSLATMMRLCPQGRNDAEGRDQLGAFGYLSDQFCRRQYSFDFESR
ncbi:hypothetical protein IWZ01DRAFT_561997 [Phyllosticta capitalensis]